MERPGNTAVDLVLGPELAVEELVSEEDVDIRCLITEVVAVELVTGGILNAEPKLEAVVVELADKVASVGVVVEVGIGLSSSSPLTRVVAAELIDEDSGVLAAAAGTSEGFCAPHVLQVSEPGLNMRHSEKAASQTKLGTVP